MKEQIQRLGNTPSVETQQGKLASTVTQASATPVIAPAPSSGQRLAQALNVGVTGATAVYGKVVEDENIKEAAYQTIEGSAAGIRYAQDVITKARELPLDQQSTYIRGKMEIGLNEIKGKNVSKSYLSAYMNSFANNTNEFDAKANETIYLQRKEETKLKTASMIVQQRIAPLGDITDKDGKVIGKQTKEDQHEGIINKIMAANDMDRAKAGELYVESMGGYIKQQAENNPNYDWQTAINTELKILSKDKAVNYATHPTYGKLIDTLESHLTTLTTARAAAYEKQQKEVKEKTTVSFLGKIFDPTTSKEELLQIKYEVIKNPTFFSTEQIKSLISSIDSAESNKGFSNTPTGNGPTLQIAAQQGKLNLTMLEHYKGYLTKEEYGRIGQDIVKRTVDMKDVVVKTNLDSINDTLANGKRMVAQVNEAGFAVNKVEARKMADYDKRMNNYLIGYRAKHNGKDPEFVDVDKMSEVAIKEILGRSYEPSKVNIVKPTPPTKQQQPKTPFSKTTEWAKKATRAEAALALNNKWITQEELRALKAGK